MNLSFRDMSLHRQFSLLAVGGVALLSLAFGTISLWSLNQSTQRVLDERLSTTRLAARYVDDTLERHLKKLTVATDLKLGTGEGGQQRLAAVWDSLAHEPGLNIHYAFRLDADGVVLQTKPDRPDVVGADFAGYPVVAQALASGQSGISDMLFPAPTGAPTVMLVVALRDADGRVTGALGEVVDLMNAGLLDYLSRTITGQTGHAHIVDSAGLVLSSTDAGEVGKPNEHPDLYISLIREGRAGVGTAPEMVGGVLEGVHVMAFVPLTTARWGIGLGQTEAETFALMRTMHNWLIGLGLSAALLALVLTQIGTRRLVRPLTALTASARRMAAGDLAGPLAIAEAGEVGSLARSFETMRAAVEERTRVAQTLSQVGVMLTARLSLDEVFEALFDLLARVAQYDSVSIQLLTEDNTLDLAAGRGFLDLAQAKEAAHEVGTQTLVSRWTDLKVMVIPDTWTDPHWIRLPGTDYIRSWVGAPLLVKGQLIGVLNVNNRSVNAYGEASGETIMSFATQAAVAVENARLFESEVRRTHQLSVLYAIDRATAQSLELEEILNDALDKVLEVIEVEAGGILLLEQDGETMLLRVHRGLSDKFVQNVSMVKVGEGLAGRAAAERRPITMDIAEYPSAHLTPFIVKEDLQSLASVPLLSGGELVGALNLATVRPRVFSPEELELLTAIGRQLGGAVANARLHEVLRASEQEYRTLVENATEFIWTMDTEGRFTFGNRQSQEVSGHKITDWIGKSFAPVIAPPEDLPRIQQIVLETLAGKSQSYEVGIYRADSSIIYLSVNTTPLYRDGQIVGTISFGRDVTAQQEAEAALTQRMAELTSLFEVSSAMRGVEGVEYILPVIVDKAVASCRADCGSMLLLDESGEMLVCRYGTGARQNMVGAHLRLGQGISGRVAQSGAAHLSPDFQHDPLLAFDPATSTRLPEIASDVCVPLRVGEQIVGAMHVSTYTARTCTEAELRLLTAIADMAASAIRRAGLLEQLERRVHELSTLFDVGKMATASLHIEDVLQFVAGAATQAVHAEGSYIFLWDEREERLALRASQGFLAEYVGHTKYRLGEGLAGWVFLEQQVVNAPDLAADPRWKREPEHESPLASGRANSALIVPLVIGKKALGVLGVINKIGAPAPSTSPSTSLRAGLRAIFTASDELLLTTLAGQIAIAIENARLYEDVHGLSVAAIRSLATAIDARDPYTRGHSEGVTALAVPVARKLGWSGADLEMLEFAALLHDVGKIAVPDAVLRKVEPLTPDEWNIIRLHPYYSAQIVKPIQPLQRIVSWVYHHQERWDGTGYPDGLKGESIPLASRIIGVVDAFNAMTTDRPYRKALSRETALTEIRRGAGKQFDPQVADTFVRIQTT